MVLETFAIRQAVAGDEDLIVDFNLRMAQETEGKQLPEPILRRGVRAVLNDATLGRYFLGCSGQQAVGQLMLTTEWSDWRCGQFWWIQSVYVAPAWRRRGALRALYSHVRQQSQATPGVVGLRLYVERNNAAAQEAYRRLGMCDASYVVYEELCNGLAQSPSGESSRRGA